MKYWIECFKKSFVFFGRARRREFWMFQLLILPLDFLITFPFISDPAVFGVCVAIRLILILPGLAVTVRRLHDIGASGWWVLCGFAALPAAVLSLFLLKDSEPGDNKYGPNPKGVSRTCLHDKIGFSLPQKIKRVSATAKSE